MEKKIHTIICPLSCGHVHMMYWIPHEGGFHLKKALVWQVDMMASVLSSCPIGWPQNFQNPEMEVEILPLQKFWFEVQLLTLPNLARAFSYRKLKLTLGKIRNFPPSTRDKVLMEGVASDSLDLSQKEQLCSFKEDISMPEESLIEHFSCVKFSRLSC